MYSIDCSQLILDSIIQKFYAAEKTAANEKGDPILYDTRQYECCWNMGCMIVLRISTD